MLVAVLTTLLFSVSALFGRRVSCCLSATHANLGRLALAGALLGLWCHLFGGGIHGRAFPVLFLSGCLGFGLGDLAMFQAYRRIGTRRTVVVIQCLAAPIGTVGEWLWLGHAPTVAQAIYGCVILGGVGIALSPPNTIAPGSPQTRFGLLFGVLAALGQASGAVLSRKAYAVAAVTGELHPLLSDGVNAAYQRMLGGIAVSIVCLAFQSLSKGSAQPFPNDWKRGTPWLIAHALTGSAAGVACFQWALMLKPTNIVLPIIATTPLVILPLAHFFEGDHVTRRAVFGSAIAVAGVIGLVQVT